MKLRRMQLAIVAIALASAMSASASLTMRLGDTSTYSGNPSGVWGITVAGYNEGKDFVAGENIGIYQLIETDGANIMPGGPSVWGVCISPSGLVDYNKHTYDVLLFENATPLNSPAWENGGLLAAAQLLNTWEPQVLASHSKLEAWGLTAAIYDVLYANSTVTFATTGDGPTVKSYYDTFIAHYGGNPIGYVLRPNPLDGQGIAGQEFLIPVPEPTTMIAGALLILPFGVSTLRSLRRKA